MEQPTGTALTNSLLAEILIENKLTNCYLKQIANEKINDTFSIIHTPNLNPHIT